MKKLIIIAAAALMCCFHASAQEDSLAPGLYAICDGEPVLMSYISGMTSKSGVGVLGFEIGEDKIFFKGTTSSIKTSGSFILVCDMSKKGITRTLKKYDVAVKSVTPDNILIIPLEVVKNKKRAYNGGKSINGINTTKRQFVDFTWEMISDNSYRIECDNIAPGEYGIAFRSAKLAPYDFDAIFDFTVPAEGSEAAGAETESEAESQEAQE